MRKEKLYTCLECNNEFKSIEHHPKFCGLSCSSKYNNKRRNLSLETKKQISESMKIYHKSKEIIHHYTCFICKKDFSSTKRIRMDRKIHCQLCKRKVDLFKEITGIQSILELSKRTVSKIFKRMKIKCLNCGWGNTTCDIHHINGKKIENFNNHSNLTYLCPNCHRLAHEKKLTKDKIVNLETYLGDKWKGFYNIKN